MGELNLDAIRARAELVSATRHRWADEVGVRDLDVLDELRRAKELAVDDVPALLAEVERLRAVVSAAENWRAAIVDDPNLWANTTDLALIEAVDALRGESGE